MEILSRPNCSYHWWIESWFQAILEHCSTAPIWSYCTSPSSSSYSWRRTAGSCHQHSSLNWIQIEFKINLHNQSNMRISLVTMLLSYFVALSCRTELHWKTSGPYTKRRFNENNVRVCLKYGLNYKYQMYEKSGTLTLTLAE